VDTTSDKNDYESTLLDAEESDVLIFSIYYNTFIENLDIGMGSLGGRGTSGDEYAFGKKYLEDLSAVTGGRVFRPEATPGGLTVAFEGIAEELRRQYNIGYYPKEESQSGQRKQIKVRVNRPNLIVRARDSYISGGNNSKPAAQPTKAETKSN
jgi:VWFA-related protein